MSHPSFRLLLLASHGVVFPDAVHLVRGALGWQVAPPLLCDDVNQDRTDCLCCLHLCALLKLQAKLHIYDTAPGKLVLP